MNTLEHISRQGLRNYLVAHLRAIADGMTEASPPSLHIASIKRRYREVAQHQIHRKPELFMQVCGTTHFHIPGGDISLQPGQICLVPDGVAHLETVKLDKGNYANLVLMFPDWGVRGLVAIAGPNNRPRIGLNHSRKTPHSARLVALLDCLTLGHNNELEIGDAGMKALLLGFLTTLSALLDREGGDANESDSNRINRCLQIINSDLHKPGLSVKALATELNCTADYLSALFKEETGENLLQYINRLRIEHAKSLLEKTSMTASEISYATGYHSPSYFNRVFRKYTRQTPGDFRSNQRL